MKEKERKKKKYTHIHKPFSSLHQLVQFWSTAEPPPAVASDAGSTALTSARSLSFLERDRVLGDAGCPSRALSLQLVPLGGAESFLLTGMLFPGRLTLC